MTTPTKDLRRHSGMNKLSRIMRLLAGRCEDLGADDATWGYPNEFSNMMVEFDDLVVKLKEIRDEYLDNDKVRKAFNEAVDSVLSEDLSEDDSGEDSGVDSYEEEDEDIGIKNRLRVAVMPSVSTSQILGNNE